MSHSLCYNERMMNIYKYIRSKDVREYNEKIGHKFTATESAFLVWLNYEITLKDKHDAWREIMREMPDEEVPKRVNADYAPSLFALLNKFIEADNRLIDEFYKKDERAVYSYRYICKGDSSFGEDFGRIYSDLGYIQGELRKDSDLGIICVEYTKKYISSHYRKIMLKTDGSGNVTSVDGDFIQGLDLSLKKDEFFEGLWIDVPTPFRKGDIVCSRKTPFGYNIYSDSKPFVLLSLANWSAKDAEERGEKLSEKDKAWKDKHLKYLKEYGDITDMTACGYFLSSDYNDRFTGEFYHEVMHDYVDLEYYRGEFNGGERVLLPIKYFLGGDIDEETLVKACEIIKKQEEVKEEIGYLNLLDEWKEKIGIIKKQKRSKKS
mgnify:CR=1 FL=1